LYTLYSCKIRNKYQFQEEHQVFLNIYDKSTATWSFSPYHLKVSNNIPIHLFLLLINGDAIATVYSVSIQEFKKFNKYFTP
jgi:hypothetical protein